MTTKKCVDKLEAKYGESINQIVVKIMYGDIKEKLEKAE
jgi:hypothetical protein